MIVADYSHLEGRPATFVDWLNTLYTVSFMPLTAPEKSIYLTLFMHANGPRGERILLDSSPGNREIMLSTGLSRSTVHRKLTTLREIDWIRVMRQGGDGRSRTVYALANLRLSSDEPPTSPPPLHVVK